MSTEHLIDTEFEPRLPGMALLHPSDLPGDRIVHLLDLTTDGLWHWDVETDVVRWSESFFELLGYPTEERGVGDILDLTHPDERDAHRAAIEHQLAHGGAYAVDIRLRCWDGAYRWLHVRGTSDHAPDGRPLRMYGHVLDLSEERGRRQALELSEKRFRSFMDNCPAGVFLKDADGVYLYVNEATADLAATDPEGMVGRATSDLFPPETAAQLRATDAAVLESGEQAHWTGTIERGDGTLRWVHDVKFPIEVTPGRHAVGGFALDVTELHQANRAAAAAQRLESVGRLAGGIAHDFNNMLSVILGSTREALEELPDGSPAAQRLAEVLEAAERSADITSQLLGFARRQHSEPRAVELEAHVRRTAEFLRRLVGGNVEMSVSVEGPIADAWIDPGQLDQVLTNLVVNARDAMGGEGRIDLILANATLEPADPPTEGSERRAVDVEPRPVGDFARISVRDTGSGMSDGVMARIFEPFFTTKAVGEGTGLGLSMVYGILRQNGGHVEVESEVGEGSTFHLYLPRHRSDSAGG